MRDIKDTHHRIGVLLTVVTMGGFIQGNVVVGAAGVGVVVVTIEVRSSEFEARRELELL